MEEKKKKEKEKSCSGFDKRLRFSISFILLEAQLIMDDFLVIGFKGASRPYPTRDICLIHLGAKERVRVVS